MDFVDSHPSCGEAHGDVLDFLGALQGTHVCYSINTASPSMASSNAHDNYITVLLSTVNITFEGHENLIYYFNTHSFFCEIIILL